MNQKAQKPKKLKTWKTQTAITASPSMVLKNMRKSGGCEIAKKFLS